MRAPVIAFALAAAVTGCKKDEKKPDEPAAKVADAAAAKPAAPPPQAAAAISGFKSVAESSGGGGALGGIGGKLGGLFGGGADTAAAAEAPAGKASDVEAPQEAPPPAFAFPPAAPKGGDCDAVADRLVLVIKAYVAAEMKEMTPEEQQMAKGMIDSMVADMRPEMLSMCKDEGWSQELRDCALVATSVADFETCDQFAPKEAAAPPSKPAPAWTGGKDCKDVGERLKQLTLASADAGDLPPGTVEQLDDYAAQLATACTEGQWSEPVRTCMVNAPTLDDIGNCFGAM